MDDRIVEAVARALQAEGMKREGSSKLTLGTVIASDLARAAITAYQAEAWQPISTAPKDGSRMLFFTGVAWVGYFRTGREPGSPPNAEWSQPGWTRLGFCDVGLNPTHWQPLPPAPKASP